MKCEKKEISTVVKEFAYTASKEEVEAKINEVLDEWCQKAKLDGFRKGKAPHALVLKSFKDKIENEALERLVKQSLAEARKENEGEIVATDPRYRVTAYEPGGNFSFILTLEFAPKFELLPLKDVKLEKILCEPTPEDLEGKYETFKKNYKKLQPTEEAIAKSDLVTVSFHSTCVGRPVKELSAPESFIRAGEERDNLFLDPIARDLMGHTKGETFTVDIQMPSGIKLKSCDGRLVSTTVTVNDVKRLVAADFNDEEAKALGFKDLEVFKKQFIEEAKARSESSLRLCHKRAVLDALADAYSFDVPTSLVRGEFSRIWRYVKPELEKARAEDDEEIRGKTDEEVQKEYNDLALRRVRLGFILNKIAEEQKVQLTPDQVRQAIAREMPADPTEAQKFVKFIQKNPGAVQQILAPTLEEVVIDKIFELADVTEKKITTKELDELLKDILPEDDIDDALDDIEETAEMDDESDGTLLVGDSEEC